MSYTAKTRIILKHGTETKWNDNLSTVLLKGEVAIFEADEQNERPRIKIGDGINTINNLPFLTPDSVLRYDIEQKLTPKQQEIVWNNLGIKSGGGSEETTTEITYEYNGDNTSDAYTWVSTYSGNKVFVKVGEVPTGTLNLVDSYLHVVNPDNVWTNYTLTINEDKLKQTVDKDGTIINATENGLIQIFNYAATDWSDNTILFICTKPGWYNLAFDNWWESLYIGSKGVYFLDKRGYGGSTYTESFTFTVTTTSGGGGGAIIEEVTPITYKGKEIQMFNRGICIGDSVTEGSFDNDDGGIIVKKYAYPEYLGRLMNAEVVNAGIAGATAQTWYEASLNSDPQWGKWVNQQWMWNMDPPTNGSDNISSALDYSGFDFAVIHIGINDIGTRGETSVEDTLTMFEWYTNQIINKLKETNSGIKIFLATIIPSYASAGNSDYAALNSRIETIVGYSTDVYLLDLNYYSECATDPAYNVIHPTALGYQKLATEIYSMISYTIKDNLSEFAQVQFCNQGVEDRPTDLTKSNWYTNAKIEELIGGASENCNTFGKVEWALSDIYANKANVVDVYNKTEVDAMIDSLRSVVLAQGSGDTLAVSDAITNFTLIAIEGTFARGTGSAVYFCSLLNITALANGSAVSVSILDGGTAYNFTANVSYGNGEITTSEPTYVYGNGKTGDATITIQRVLGIR